MKLRSLALLTACSLATAIPASSARGANAKKDSEQPKTPADGTKEAEMALKARLYGERYPYDEDFLAALARMPPACGVALGFDRLVMLLTGATRIEQVLWGPVA